MCPTEETLPSSAAEALAQVRAGLAHVAALDPAELTISEQAEVLRGLAQCEAVQLAAASRVFTAFGRSGGAAADGAATPRSWLRWQCRVTSAAAGLAAAWARRLAAHPRIADALARAEVSVSWAKALCEWTDELPEAHRDAADGVLLGAGWAWMTWPGRPPRSGPAPPPRHRRRRRLLRASVAAADPALARMVARSATTATVVPQVQSEPGKGSPRMLSLVIPKGSLERATLELFDAADLTVRRSSERDYHATIDDPRIDRVRFLRPQEIPTYVEQGLFDFGITGRDWITETGADVVSLGELQYSKSTSAPVRVVLAVPSTVPWHSVTDLPEGVRISTELPALTRRYLESHGVKAVVVPSYGATEAKVPDIVDAIVDLTETGTSLRRNGLRILDTLLTSYTELVANPDACADHGKREAMEDIALLLRGAIRARGQVLVKLNVSAADLNAVTSILPAMSSPTITSLARGDMNAVEAVVPKQGINRLIPALKAAGARDILEVPISKIVD